MVGTVSITKNYLKEVNTQLGLQEPALTESHDQRHWCHGELATWGEKRVTPIPYRHSTLCPTWKGPAPSAG